MGSVDMIIADPMATQLIIAEERAARLPQGGRI